MEASVFLMRNGVDEYSLYVYDVDRFGSIKTISKMNEPKLQEMVVCLREMTRIEKALSVFFPNNLPDVNVSIVKRINPIEYNMVLNLGMTIISQMDETEFHETLFEMETICMQQIGTKVYFPPLKKEA